MEYLHIFCVWLSLQWLYISKRTWESFHFTSRKYRETSLVNLVTHQAPCNVLTCLWCSVYLFCDEPIDVRTKTDENNDHQNGRVGRVNNARFSSIGNPSDSTKALNRHCKSPHTIHDHENLKSFLLFTLINFPTSYCTSCTYNLHPSSSNYNSIALASGFPTIKFEISFNRRHSHHQARRMRKEVIVLTSHLSYVSS